MTRYEKEQIIDFLLMIINKELEEEYETTNDKEWLQDYIKAEQYLLELKDTMPIVVDEIIKDDIKKYL